MSEWLISVLTAQYALMFIVWGLVFYHYGSTTLASWRVQNGTIGGLVADLFYPLRWAWARAIRYTGFRRDHCPLVEPEGRYSAGTILRFAITITAITPAFRFVRVLWSNPVLVSVSAMMWEIFILTFSVIGGLAHLLVAYRETPDRWVALVVFSTIFTFLGPVLFHFFW